MTQGVNIRPGTVVSFNGIKGKAVAPHGYKVTCNGCIYRLGEDCPATVAGVACWAALRPDKLNINFYHV